MAVIFEMTTIITIKETLPYVQIIVECPNKYVSSLKHKFSMRKKLRFKNDFEDFITFKQPANLKKNSSNKIFWSILSLWKSLKKIIQVEIIQFKNHEPK